MPTLGKSRIELCMTIQSANVLVQNGEGGGGGSGGREVLGPSVQGFITELKSYVNMSVL